MAEQKIKVSELPEAEQKDLIAKATALGVRGVAMTGWTVETLKQKIAEAEKAQNGEQPEDAKADEVQEEPKADEQAPSEAPAEEPKADEVNEEPLPDGLSQEAQDFLNGETDKLPNDAEEITEEEAEEMIPWDVKKEEEPAKKVNGICHICRSKVVDGVCTGCGFTTKR